MKFYVSVDMEGIAGVVLREQLMRGEALYEEARHLLTAEVNAVVGALAECGATDVIVKDAHGRGFNFVTEKLSEHARYVLGASKMDNRFPLLDSTFDGAFLIGYHAMAGTKLAIRDHTMTSLDWQSLTLNGRQIGEIGMDAAIFGSHGVPVLMVSGDDKTCAEARSELGPIVTYETKQAFGRHVGVTKAPRTVYREIAESVKSAVTNREKCKPHRIDGPYELEIRFMSTDLADARYYDGEFSQRLDGLRAVYRETDFVRLLSRSM